MEKQDSIKDISTVSNGLGPVIPRIGLSKGTLAFEAGSEGAIQQLSALPTITCFKGSKSFHEFTILIIVSPYNFLYI